MNGASIKESISLVIPALNEEEAIVGTLTKAVAELRSIAAEEPDIEFCEVILVDDGSTDRTRAWASSIPGVKIISYPRNRGYGWAIETGFAAARGTLLSFMDADGTCDPGFLRKLWARMKETDAHVVLGNRLHKGSEIPHVRRLGNTLYAWLLSLISGTRVRDTASGMRLIRRDAMERLRPLPGGLSFTPAMSARCVLDPELRIADIDMPYAERQGESKLHVLRDGLRFLDVILTTAVFYTPLRMFGGLALCATALGLAGGVANLAAGVGPLDRPSLVFLPVLAAGLFAALGLVFHIFSKRMIPVWPTSRLEHAIAHMLRVRYLLVLGGASLMLAGWFVTQGLPVTRANLHLWSGVLLGYGALLCVFVACGVFIVRRMDEWKGAALQPDRLLQGAEVLEGGSSISRPTT